LAAAASQRLCGLDLSCVMFRIEDGRGRIMAGFGIPKDRLLVPVLGIFQISAWGSSYYLLAVLAKPIASDTGWPSLWIVGSLSAGLLVAGIVSPRVGALIGRYGGRPVLAAAAILLAIGLVLIGSASNLAMFAMGWLLIGIGMAAGLYDPAFATLGHILGDKARPAITTLTLSGGFASMICWPLSALFVDHFGWRGACFAYALIHLGISLPILLIALPDQTRFGATASRYTAGAALTRRERQCYLLIGALVVMNGAIMTIIRCTCSQFCRRRD
jgi:MFS family permease